ncbi:MAG: hypothetical protein K0R28_569 [Paenibacillus sp.]|nr:hypothetical protein [Paenibacillus sp.]
MGALGSIVVGIFGVFWTIGAASMGAPSFFVLFGVIFIGMAVIQGIVHFKNATGQNRMSLYDITDSNEEPDPFTKYVNNANASADAQAGAQGNRFDYAQPEGPAGPINFCPFCETPVKDEAYRYCAKCGKEIRKA